MQDNALTFEEKIYKNLYDYLLEKNEIDSRFPEALDIEEKWPIIAQSYLPDGIREFRDFPISSLGWIMYVGMAIAQFWEDDWEIYGQMEDLYTYLRDKEGFDTMDEYIRRTVLHLKGEAFTQTEVLIQECASRANAELLHSKIEPGTKEAFEAYVSCLHQLYRMGMAVQLRRLGYHMQAMQ
ncbi:MAG: hypothetical protein MJZ76_01650 [Bacteroidales bacterium]|nr:hypothetical protein [Bacteroidales bacterium]